MRCALRRADLCNGRLHVNRGRDRAVKILCVGRNYVKHAKELGNTAPPASGTPIWFWKPESAIIQDGDTIELPSGIGPVHHEVELALRIGKSMRHVSRQEALGFVDGITVANDLTARDLQQAAAKAGLPWAQAKGYDTFLPMGAWQEVADRNLQNLELKLWVNDELRQNGNTRDMVFDVQALLAHASSWTTLKPGDILLTGTPEGVGPLAPGHVRCEIPGVAKLQNPVRLV